MPKYLILLLVIVLYGCQKGVTYQFDGRTMGTGYMVKIANQHIGDKEGDYIRKQVEEALVEVNQQMSTWIPESEISRLNRWTEEKPFKISKPFSDVLLTGIRIHKESEGAFDMTVAPLVNLWGFGSSGTRDTLPSAQEVRNMMERIGTYHIKLLNDSLVLKTNPDVELDLSAIAKGFGVDVVAGVLQDLGYTDFLVEIGGEVVVSGMNGDARWKIGIDRPDFESLPGSQLQEVLHVTDIAMATSGDYRNYFVSEDSVYSHTIDPKTGRPIVNGVASATVLGPSCMEADAIATALMVMGPEKGIRWIESRDGFETMMILREKEQFKEICSSGFKVYLKDE